LARLLKYPMLTSELFPQEPLVFCLASCKHCKSETEKISLMTMWLLSAIKHSSFHFGFSFCGGEDGYFEIHRTGKESVRVTGINNKILEKTLAALEKQGVVKDDMNLSQFLTDLTGLFENYSAQKEVNYEQATQWLRENYEQIRTKAKNKR